MIYLFYGSALPALFLIPLWGVYMKQWAEDMTSKKEAEFRNQFRDCIQAMSAALKAGYSAENAIRETKRDIAPMYSPDKRIMKELRLMVHSDRDEQAGWTGTGGIFGKSRTGKMWRILSMYLTRQRKAEGTVSP